MLQFYLHFSPHIYILHVQLLWCSDQDGSHFQGPVRGTPGILDSNVKQTRDSAFKFQKGHPVGTGPFIKPFGPWAVVIIQLEFRFCILKQNRNLDGPFYSHIYFTSKSLPKSYRLHHLDLCYAVLVVGSMLRCTCWRCQTLREQRAWKLKIIEF